MSTNYYIATKDNDEAIHIGKYSGGHIFMFNGQVHKTVDAWMVRLANLAEGETIRSEYGVETHPCDFFSETVAPTLGAKNSSRTYALSVGQSNPAGASIAWSFLTGKLWEDGGYEFCDREFC